MENRAETLLLFPALHGAYQTDRRLIQIKAIRMSAASHWFLAGCGAVLL